MNSVSIRAVLWLCGTIVVVVLGISAYRLIYDRGAKSRDAEVAALQAENATIRAVEAAATIAVGERLEIAVMEVDGLKRARDERNKLDFKRVEEDRRGRESTRGEFDRRLRDAIARACGNNQVRRPSLPPPAQDRPVSSAEAAGILPRQDDRDSGTRSLAADLGEYSREADSVNGQYYICYREVAKDNGASIVRRQSTEEDE